jgi:hypothetical protein
MDQAERLDKMIEEGYDFPHHYGRLQRVLGDLAFDEGRYDDALRIYAGAYALLSKRQGGYGRRTFGDELNMLTERIDQLAEHDPQQAIEWCDTLSDYWSKADLVTTRRKTMLSRCKIHKAKAGLRVKGQRRAK